MAPCSICRSALYNNVRSAKLIPRIDCVDYHGLIFPALAPSSETLQTSCLSDHKIWSAEIAVLIPTNCTTANLVLVCAIKARAGPLLIYMWILSFSDIDFLSQPCRQVTASPLDIISSLWTSKNQADRTAIFLGFSVLESTAMTSPCKITTIPYLRSGSNLGPIGSC